MSVDIARANVERYGSYPLSSTFANNDNVTELPDTAQPAYSAAFDPNDGIKRHAACDECRKRKLKCSGEPTGCTKCVKQNLVCHYSEQKPMGRPRKRQKTDDDPPVPSKSALSPPRPIQPAPEIVQEPSFTMDIIDPNLAIMDNERTRFENICNGPVAQTIRNSRQASLQEQATPGLSGTSDASISQHGLPTPDQFDVPSTQYPTDVAQWPDFSTMEMLPLPVEDKWRGFESSANVQFDPDANPEALSNLPSIPACPCLPNLYLTLSTLSTLSSFPYTQQTIRTVETAFRTAQGVIYCSVCPQKFDTGSSNLMLACTLLNVLSSQWNRWRKLGADELRTAFGIAAQQQSRPSTREGHEWRQFAHQMLRAYVFGDASIPAVPGSNSMLPAVKSQLPLDQNNIPVLTLMALVDALTRRQRQWHGLDELTDEFPDRITPDLTHGHMIGGDADGHPGKHLCLEIVDHTRCIVKKLDGPLGRCNGQIEQTA